MNFYCGSVVYTGSKTVEYVMHSQGMARLNGSVWEYQYNVTDHHARLYDPSKGIFGQVDPLAEEDASTSPFAYCVNNPIINIDLDGKQAANVVKYAAKPSRFKKMKDAVKVFILGVGLYIIILLMIKMEVFHQVIIY